MCADETYYKNNKSKAMYLYLSHVLPDVTWQFADSVVISDKQLQRV
jgi:hypothetical protein